MRIALRLVALPKVVGITILTDEVLSPCIKLGYGITVTLPIIFTSSQKGLSTLLCYRSRSCNKTRMRVVAASPTAVVELFVVEANGTITRCRTGQIPKAISALSVIEAARQW